MKLLEEKECDDVIPEDNDAESIQRDCAQFDKMLKELDHTLSIVTTQQRAGSNLFIMPSHSLPYKKRIEEWLQENVSTVRYSLCVITHTGRERVQVDGEWHQLLATRRTLAIEREAYRQVCPRFCTTITYLVHFSLLAFCLFILHRLVIVL